MLSKSDIVLATTALLALILIVKAPMRSKARDLQTQAEVSQSSENSTVTATSPIAQSFQSQTPQAQVNQRPARSQKAATWEGSLFAIGQAMASHQQNAGRQQVNRLQPGSRPASSAGSRPSLRKQLGEEKVAELRNLMNQEDRDLDLLQRQMGLSDEQVQTIQQVEKKLYENLRAADNLRAKDPAKASAYRTYFLTRHQQWMQSALGVEGYERYLASSEGL